MNNLIWISLGAILGANLRYAINLLSLRYISTLFPVGTLIINSIGSFILGIFLAITFLKSDMDTRWFPFISIGFCGAFTTFSGFSYDTIALYEQNNYLLASLNILLNNILCLLAVAAGFFIAKNL